MTDIGWRRAWGALIAAYAITLLRTAWLSDDAFLSFRCADNWIHGYGLRWNVDERVQVFTNPLWTFLIAGLFAITREIWATALIFSGVVSIGVAVLFIAWSGWTWAGLAGLTVLLVSRAFIDFSTSGLENPLLHFLLVAFLWTLRSAATSTRVRRPFLAAALLATTRDDALLLTLPALAYLLRGRPRRAALRDALQGFSPYLLWKLIALVYFGFPAPNTAYAKLAAGVSWTELVPQGLHYFVNSLQWDPVTLIAIGVGLVCGFRARTGWMRAAAAGIVLYLLYIVRIGGDFMSGRFFAAPLVVAMALAVDALRDLRPRRAMAAAVVLLVYGVLFPRSPLRTGKDYRKTILREYLTDARGVTDERAHYHQFSNPLCRVARQRMPSYKGVEWGLEQRVNGVTGVQRVLVVGMRGFYAGPKLHLIEGYGLEDPLLARLRMPAGTTWRIGHFPRPIPPGYIETLMAGRNHIADPAIARYYDELALVTRGPIWSARRFGAILALNTTRRTAN